MGATYTAGQTTAKDKARLALGDIAAPFLMEDEDYEAIVGDANVDPTKSALSTIAGYLANICANRAIESEAGPVRRKYLDRSKFYKQLASEFASQVEIEETTVSIPAMGQFTNPVTETFERMVGTRDAYGNILG